VTDCGVLTEINEDVICHVMLLKFEEVAQVHEFCNSRAAHKKLTALLVKTVPLLNVLAQLFHILDLVPVNADAQNAPHHIINWTEVRTVGHAE